MSADEESKAQRSPWWRTVPASVNLVRRAGGGTFVTTVLLLATSSVGMIGLLIIGNAVLQDLVRRGEGATATPRTWALLIMVVLIAGVISFASTAGAGLHRLLIERTVPALLRRRARSHRQGSTAGV